MPNGFSIAGPSNPVTAYRGYEIECDDEYGYIVKRGCVDLMEFGTRKEAEDYIDAIIAEAR